ncbi:MAG: hypothetical protein ABIO83_05705 [Ilumatobacteraceae bacterium]
MSETVDSPTPNSHAVGVTIVGSDPAPSGNAGGGIDADTTDEAFNPDDHTVEEVQAYLDDHPDDADRVLAAEADGKGRKSLATD